MSEIKVDSVVNSTGDNDSGIDLSTNDQVILKTANTTALTINSSQNATFANKLATTNLGTGAILQVVQTVKSDTFDTSSTGPLDITVLSVAITPNFTSSKVLVMFDVHIVGFDAGIGLRLLRGSTTLTMGDASGSMARMMATGL